MESRRRAQLGLVVVAVYLVAVATRLAPLHWSPLPATLDGFVYASHASAAVTTGQYPLVGNRADHLSSPVTLAVAALVTGVEPLTLAQGLYGIVGATTAIVAVLFATQLGRAREWHARRIAWVATLAGIGIAVDGLFVRRTGVPENEAFTLLVIPLAALALYRVLRGGSSQWLLSLLPLLVILPLTHTFSALVAALILSALVAAECVRTPDRATLLRAVGLVGGFWAFIIGYYSLAGRTALTVPYVDRVTAFPGLFVAWTVVLAVGVVWYQRTSRRLQRGLVLAPMALFFLLAVINRVRPVFPGTATTPVRVLVFVLPLAVVVLIAGRAAPRLGDRRSVGVILLATVAAPVSHVLFGLTASLTPDMFATVIRAQTFAHVPVVVIAAAGAVGLAARWDVPRADGPRSTGTRLARARPLVVVVLLVTLLATTPVAYVTLDTGFYPKGSTQSELAASGFHATYGTAAVTTDHKQGRITRSHFGASAARDPLVTWLDGGPPPESPLLSKRYWHTHGAHLWPAAPRAIPVARFECTLQQRDRVYHSSGIHDMALTLPGKTTATRC
jgi:hypothetical protein